MIIKKNKKTVYPEICDQLVDKALNRYQYNGNSKIYGSRYKLENYATNKNNFSINKDRFKVGTELEDA